MHIANAGLLPSPLPLGSLGVLLPLQNIAHVQIQIMVQPQKILPHLEPAPCTLQWNAYLAVWQRDVPSLATTSKRIRLRPLAVAGLALARSLFLIYFLVSSSVEEQSIHRNKAYEDDLIMLADISSSIQLAGDLPILGTAQTPC